MCAASVAFFLHRTIKPDVLVAIVWLYHLLLCLYCVYVLAYRGCLLAFNGFDLCVCETQQLDCCWLPAVHVAAHRHKSAEPHLHLRHLRP